MALTLDKLKTLDGTSSGLDADLLDGLHANQIDADKLDGSHATAFAPVLADVKSAAITAESGWSLSSLNVAKSGSWMFISGVVVKSGGVIAHSVTKFATMSAGYRPGEIVVSPCMVGDTQATAGGDAGIAANGDVSVYSADASNRSYASFTVIYPIA